jgi:hypothetical protein
MGHLDTCQKNIQSTKKLQFTPLDPTEAEEDYFPAQPDSTIRTHNCFLAAIDYRHCVYTDQTGSLQNPSSEGNNYLLVAYDYDSNCIFYHPLKDKTGAVLTAAIKDIHDELTKGGCQPKFHRLDNECPKILKDYFNKRKITYQLAPPHDHSRQQQCS